MTNQRFTRLKDAAKELHLSVRQIDRLVEQGELIKRKTGARRSVIETESLEAFIARRNGMAVDGFVSDHQTIKIGFPDGFPRGFGAALDVLLAQRLPGIFVAEFPPHEITLNWAWSIGYAPQRVADELDRLSAERIKIAAQK